MRRWILLLLPATAWAQSLTIVLPDTVPATLAAWHQIAGEIVVVAPEMLVARMVGCIELSSTTICTPFERQPVLVVADTLRMPIVAVMAEFLLHTQPLYRSNRIPGGLGRMCMQLVDANDSSRAIISPVCREFFVRGVPDVRLDSVAPFIEVDSVCFRWHVAIPVGVPTVFQLRIAERRPGQSSWYAVVRSVPVATCRIHSDRLSKWECCFPLFLFRRGVEYVWGIFADGGGSQEELISPVGEFVLR
ncbi:MAG: hypothetical protein RMK00_00110 [Bacteroidota bacterium]|nr:hypothetical protein [Chlorobiota bacterium]MDW8074166.1 hypothetical protein [Bacteroidota bacterium]